MAELETEVKLLKKELQDQAKIHDRLDVAIEKLTDVSNSIHRMLAVHEEKIARQEQIDEVIFDKLKERAGEIDTVHRELSKEIQQVEKKLLLEIRQMKLDIGGRVGILEKYRWLIMGGAVVIGWFIALNGQEILEMMK